MSRGNVLFCLTGSIACYKACAAISRLAQAGVAAGLAGGVLVGRHAEEQHAADAELLHGARLLGAQVG